MVTRDSIQKIKKQIDTVIAEIKEHDLNYKYTGKLLLSGHWLTKLSICREQLITVRSTECILQDEKLYLEADASLVSAANSLQITFLDSRQQIQANVIATDLLKITNHIKSGQLAVDALETLQTYQMLLNDLPNTTRVTELKKQVTGLISTLTEFFKERPALDKKTEPPKNSGPTIAQLIEQNELEPGSVVYNLMAQQLGETEREPENLRTSKNTGPR